MDVKKLSNDALRQKIRIATFDASNLPDAEARKKAAALQADLQKELDHRLHPRLGPGKRFARRISLADWRVLGREF